MVFARMRASRGYFGHIPMPIAQTYDLPQLTGKVRKMKLMEACYILNLMLNTCKAVKHRSKQANKSYYLLLFTQNLLSSRRFFFFLPFTMAGYRLIGWHVALLSFPHKTPLQRSQKIGKRTFISKSVLITIFFFKLLVLKKKTSLINY